MPEKIRSGARKTSASTNTRFESPSALLEISSRKRQEEEEKEEEEEREKEQELHEEKEKAKVIRLLTV
jgi:hypothetical protein